MNPLKDISLAAASLLALGSSTAIASVISLNFVVSTATDSQNINADETFGVGVVNGVNTTVGGWNNSAGATQAAVSSSGSNLKWNDGSSSTVGFSASHPSGRDFYGAGYVDTPLNVSLEDYTGGEGTTVTFTGLASNFPAGYFAVVYAVGFSGATPSLGGSISDGTSTFYYRPLVPQSTPNPWTQTTQTTDLGSGANPIAQYAVFGSTTNPLTADALTFSVAALYGAGVGFGGVQLVAVPEPAHFAALASLAVIGGTVVLRRRRRL